VAHRRQLIREAVKDALIEADTSAGERVYGNRMVPWRRTQLPAIAVYTLEESVDPDSKTTAPRILRRTLQLVVDAVTEESSTIEDELDALCVQIEAAMDTDETFSDVCARSILESTDIDILEDGEKLLGRARLIYAVEYDTEAPDAENVVLDDFNEASIDYNLENAVHEDNQATDLLEDIQED
jgi:hypothetical protein